LHQSKFILKKVFQIAQKESNQQNPWEGVSRAEKRTFLHMMLFPCHPVAQR
jgi:hypothetical protein